MGSTKILIAASIMVVITTLMGAVPGLAKEIIVGDEAGWKLDFNYQDWAKGKDFQVGDKLSMIIYLLFFYFASIFSLLSHIEI